MIRITMRCVECGDEADVFFEDTPAESHFGACAGCGKLGGTEKRRVWQSPRINAVKGAGGSPGRSGGG